MESSPRPSLPVRPVLPHLLEPEAGQPRTVVSVGLADHASTVRAGRAAVEEARLAGPQRLPSFALMFSTSRHDPEVLLATVRGDLPDVPVYGGYAVGVLSKSKLGYDGFQIGIALFWLEDAECDVFVSRDLRQREKETGNDLVGQLCGRAFRGTPSLLLLYDFVNRTGNRFQLNMATTLLSDGFSRLASHIPLVGAGLVGDMQCRATHQWTGQKVETQTALLMAFSGGLAIEQVVLHGCRPASAYHEITRVDHNVVLEIDGRRALDVVEELLGPESGRSWRDYAFFVTLGVNKGDKFGSFDPDAYANRMCMSVDAERGGLIMFEPDLQVGDQVQLMLRDVDFSYIGDKISEHLRCHAPQRPVFALYVDCAGRASAYSHLEQEEASFVQAALRDVCPLLGFYTGVEVARINGRPQALDWTGVLCLFYQREVATPPAGVTLLPAALERDARKRDGLAHAGGMAALQAELAYYRRNLDHAAGEQVRFDAHSSAMSQRLRQREEGFRVLASLRQTITVRRRRHEIYQDALGLLLSSMAIDRAVVVEADEDGSSTRIVAAIGYSPAEAEAIRSKALVLPQEIQSAGALIANKADRDASLAQLRDALRLPFFLAVPIHRPGHRVALIVGREREIKPFFPPFDQGDAANFQAIASFLSSVIDNLQLFDETEKMASSFRRFVPEPFLKILGRNDFKKIQLGDQVARHMAVLVTDIRSFSTLSERMSPEMIFSFVNEFLAEVGPVVRSHEGFVSKYIGDAVMALFGETESGLDAAVALIRQIGLLNERRRLAKKFAVQIGIAVNSGDIMLGVIGEAERLEGTVLADAVNLCFRLESLTKIYGAQIITTDETLAELPNAGKYQVRPIDLVTVKGRRGHVTVIEVLDGLPAERLDAKLATRDLYSEGFQSFEFGAYDEAARTFREVAKIDADDRAARAMMLKARKLAEGGADVDLD